MGTSWHAKLVAAAAISFALIGLGLAANGPPARAEAPWPIKHVVILFQENHSFNDLLGKLCVDDGNRCAGTTIDRFGSFPSLASVTRSVGGLTRRDWSLPMHS